MVGLVSKARREKQMASLKVNSHIQESNKSLWLNAVQSKLCKCGNLTAGIYKDGANRCNKCGEKLG